jgi:hypothetical protein
VERPRPPVSARARSPFPALALAGFVAAATACAAPGSRPVAAPPAARSPGSFYPRGATLSPAEAAEEVAYYRERSAILAAPTNVEIARTDFARLRRGRLYLTEGLRSREIADLQRRLTMAFGAGNGPEVLEVTGRILTLDQADLRAHSLRSITLRRAGQTSEADAQHEIVIGLLESIIRSGDGLGFASAWTVFDVSEEYEVLKAEGCLPKSQGLAAQGDRSFDVLRARRFTDGSPCDFYFDITEMMAVVARHFPGGPR